MRFVSRSEVAKPAILSSSESRSALEALKAYYDWLPEQRKSRRPPLENQLWADESVHSALLKLFRQKCAYCEQRLELSESYLGVDHYRPLRHAKGGSHAESRDSIDHYAWLAYEWNNLLLSCPACNRAKRNEFPTKSTRAAPMTRWRQCDRTERPLLLNPCVDKPARHLSYSIDGTCFSLTERGEATIAILELNRPELVTKRAMLFLKLISELELVIERMEPYMRSNTFKDLPWLVDPDAELSGVAIAFLERPFRRLRRTAEGRSLPRELTIEVMIDFLAKSSEGLLRFYLSQLESSAIEMEWIQRSRISSQYAMADTLIGAKHRVRLDARMTGVHLRKFKGVEDLYLKFDRHLIADHEHAPAAALLGENSCGKSSILQAIALALMPQRHARGLPLDFRRGLVKHQQQAPFEAAPAEVIIEFDSGQARRLTIRADGRLTQEGGDEALVLGYGAHRMFGDEQGLATNFAGTARIKSLFRRNKELPHSAAWLRNQDDYKFNAVSRAMREILSLGVNDEISRDDAGNILVDRSGDVMPVSRLSDGYRSLFAMALDIMRNMVEEYGNLEEAKGYVLIDEIELHLHPRWKMKVVTALRRAMPGVQFIFATHDPLCLRGLYDGEVHVLFRDELRQVRAMEGLPDVRTMRAEQLLTSDYFGLSSTSDPDMARELESLALSSFVRKVDPAGLSPSAVLPIGDTTLDQVINEGVRIHLKQTLDQRVLDRSMVRDEAVQQVLALLRRWRNEQSQ